MNTPVAIVTGGASGIGRATCLRFALEGYNIVVADLDTKAGNATVNEIIDNDGNAIFVATDVSNEQSCIDLATKAVKKWGQIDVLVANAGVQIGGDLLTATEADWNRILGVNLKGVAYCCRAALPHMIRKNAGAIVITSSNNAFVGCPDMAIYDASKAALLALTRSLACKHGADGIRVNAICPGATVTDFHEKKAAETGVSPAELREMTKGYGLIGRAAEPSEIASVIHFLASADASFVTGQAIIADGGASVTAAG